MKLNSRIAPTPSGFLHLGNMASFLYTWLRVRQSGGTLLLRIDDIDNERFRESYLQYIFDALQHAGISYDIGPENRAAFHAQWSQQQRLALYNAYAEQLWQTGQIYTCTCSRQQLAKKGCNCRLQKLPPDTPQAAWRLHLPPGTIVSWQDEGLGNVSIRLDEVMQPPIIKRHNQLPSYHLASIADDVLFNINFIVRGKDLLHSSALQLYIAELLQLEPYINIRLLHHPLVSNQAGEKLSKSAGKHSENHPPALPDVKQCIQQVIEWFPAQFVQQPNTSTAAGLLAEMI